MFQHLGLAAFNLHPDHDTGASTANSLELNAQWLWLTKNERNLWKITSGQMLGAK